MKKIILIILFIFLVPTVSLADDEDVKENKPRDKKEAGSGPNPYTDCGIGSVFDNEYGASSSNAIWDLGSTAITSAISSPENCRSRKAETARLILETLPELEKNVALGEGKYLSALTEVMGCDKNLQDKISSDLRVIYADFVNDKAYGTKSAKQRATDMYNSVKMATDSMQSSCKAIL